MTPPPKQKDSARYGVLLGDFDRLIDDLRHPRRFPLTARTIARAATAAPAYFAFKLAGIVAVGVLCWALLMAAVYLIL
jgi:hypothetical protein